MNIARITHDVQQGTGPWLRLREGFDTASEAPSALGVGKYTSRADLLRLKHTGIAPEHDAATLGRFAAGHAAEAKARPMAEDIAGDELFPVTMSTEIAGLKLLASLDGLTLDGETAWETKLWNEELAAAVRNGELPEHYTVQMDQELFVSGAKRCLFTCTDGTPERFVFCWYESSPEKIDALLHGWMQFHSDLAAYSLPESPEPAPVGRAPETLPALLIEVTGKVTASNLAEFKQTALESIRSVNRDLRTDADFADAEHAVKWCGDVESRLKAAKEHALSQTASIDALFKAIDDISAEARAVRLDLDKLVTRRKQEIREEAVARTRRALDAHVAALNAEIAPVALPQPVVDFAGAIKGKRSIDSMQAALDQVLADAKIEADAAARKIRANAAAFQRIAQGSFSFLFPDLSTLVHKATEDFDATLSARIAQHRAAEAERTVKAAAEAAAKHAAETALAVAAAAAPPPFAPPVANQVAPVHPATLVASPSANEPATLKLGTICERLGITMTAAFIETALGIKPARTDGRALLYREIDFGRICAALQMHVERVYAASRQGT